MTSNTMAEADEDIAPVVIDNGSSLFKIGLSGDDASRAVFSTVVGRPKYGVPVSKKITFALLSSMGFQIKRFYLDQS